MTKTPVKSDAATSMEKQLSQNMTKVFPGMEATGQRPMPRPAHEPQFLGSNSNFRKTGFIYKK